MASEPTRPAALDEIGNPGGSRRKPSDSSGPAKPAAPEGGDVLVFNRQGGPYQMTHSAPLGAGERPVGAGDKDPIHNRETTRVTILPGLKLVSAVDWAKCSGNGGFKGRVEDQSLTILNAHKLGKRPESGYRGAKALAIEISGTWEDGWSAISPARAEEMVELTADVSTLRRLLEVEERARVVAALEAQLAECEGDGAMRAQARRVQRTMHRTAKRRRS